MVAPHIHNWRVMYVYWENYAVFKYKACTCGKVLL